MNLNAFPNPASNSINVELPSTSTFVLIQIFNAEGKSVLHKSISGSQFLSIDIGKLNSGLYQINAIGETIVTQSIIKL